MKFFFKIWTPFGPPLGGSKGVQGSDGILTEFRRSLKKVHFVPFFYRVSRRPRNRRTKGVLSGFGPPRWGKTRIRRPLATKVLLILNSRRGPRQGHRGHFLVRFLGLRSGGSPGGLFGGLRGSKREAKTENMWPAIEGCPGFCGRFGECFVRDDACSSFGVAFVLLFCILRMTP